MSLDDFAYEDEESELSVQELSRGAYQPERDGPLSEYLRLQIVGRELKRLFYGLEHFLLLKKEGWLVEGSSIRFMYGQFRGDECYMVTADFMLEGIEANVHSAQSGIHDPAYLFARKNCPRFEADYLFGPARQKLLNEIGKVT